ncbi:outer membrane beta-barrel protein|uniref:outer membrane beta-barrel protein n=1 Tax=Pseudomonas sp. SbOxS1 TaxID=2723884 RepID=UPI0015D280D0|nr:outer membrane beta-barrel protein [Pseudomonas sp. SbOxS1]NYU06167.1 outer membrane beta-barrel protein [Pseudomonas sp. SbOxS1]
MKNINVKTFGAALLVCATGQCQAGQFADVGEGTVFRSLFGNSLERDYGITVSGLLDAGFSRNDNSSHDDRKSGQTNTPVAGFSDEGFELATLHLFVDKALKANFIPRITPLPGPAPSEASFGFTLEAAYGRNAQQARTYGWDMHWGINSPGDDDPDKARRDKQNFLAVPNIAATAYLPYAGGFTAIAGIFGSGLGYEIPPNIRAARNPFASRSYAFTTESGAVSGFLLGKRLVSNQSMLLGAELGVIQGQGNLRDNNDRKALLGALRWRTPDMRTWIDYEFLVGDSQSDSDDVQTPRGRVVSQDGQFKQQHSLNGWHRFNEQWSMGGEMVYGHQDGDGKASTVDIVTGPGFDGARWWGANVVVTYQQRKDLSFSVRAEHFDDPDGFILFPSSTAPGAFNALTMGLRYDANKYLSLRPELRYDWFDARDNAKPFGQGDARNQLTATVEALVYF